MDKTRDGRWDGNHGVAKIFLCQNNTQARILHTDFDGYGLGDLFVFKNPIAKKIPQDKTHKV